MIERSTNTAVIKALATHPTVFPYVSDDFFPDPEAWQPPESETIVYLLAKDAEGFFGFGAFIPENLSCWKAHMGFLPRSYGVPAIEAFGEMLAWMWKHTTAARIVGEICQENRRAIQFAVRSGFEPYGVNRKSRLRGGILRDQVCLGISKPGVSAKT
jgi:hypothetical protein